MRVKLSAEKIAGKVRDYQLDRTELWKKTFASAGELPKLESLNPISFTFEADKQGHFSGNASIIVSKTVRFGNEELLGTTRYDALVSGHLKDGSVVVDELTLEPQTG